MPAAGGGVAGGRGARPLPPRDRRAGAARHAGGRSQLRHQGQLLLAASHEEHSQADMSAMFHPASAYSHLNPPLEEAYPSVTIESGGLVKHR